VVHQKVSGQGGEPGGKCPFFNTIAAQRAINPDKDVLREVFGVMGRIGEPVAQVVDAPVVQAHNRLPRRGVAGQASVDKLACLLVLQAVSPCGS
jgi:hypothetical protein